MASSAMFDSQLLHQDAGGHGGDNAGLSGLDAADAPVRQVFSIPRKVFEQLSDGSPFAHDTLKSFEISSGARVEVLEQESQRMGSSANGFSVQPYGNAQHTKPRREYSLKAIGTRTQIETVKAELNKLLKTNDPGERVSLKMDVSFSDHSFIIGRFGRGIQTVMQRTNCHIHFPDSNRNNAFEKSNQVSISGPPDGVKAARQQIRELLPISFAFVIKNNHYHAAMKHTDNNCVEPRPQIQQMLSNLQNECRITITLLPMTQLESALVTVRGRHGNINRIKDGIMKLMATLLPSVPQVDVHIGIEVSPHHLDFVMGPKAEKINNLMRETDTFFSVPNNIYDQRHQIPTVRISGKVMNVYDAWVKFMDLLPLALLVDIPFPGENTNFGHSLSDSGLDNTSPLTSAESVAEAKQYSYRIDDVAYNLTVMLQEFDINVISRQKTREMIQWLCIIKGPEKYVELMFEAYKSLSQEDPIHFMMKAVEDWKMAQSTDHRSSIMTQQSWFGSQTNGLPSCPVPSPNFPWSHGQNNHQSSPAAQTSLNNRNNSAYLPVANMLTSTPIRNSNRFVGGSSSYSADQSWTSSTNSTGLSGNVSFSNDGYGFQQPRIFERRDTRSSRFVESLGSEGYGTSSLNDQSLSPTSSPLHNGFNRSLNWPPQSPNDGRVPSLGSQSFNRIASNSSSGMTTSPSSDSHPAYNLQRFVSRDQSSALRNSLMNNGLSATIEELRAVRRNFAPESGASAVNSLDRGDMSSLTRLLASNVLNDSLDMRNNASASSATDESSLPNPSSSLSSNCGRYSLWGLNELGGSSGVKKTFDAAPGGSNRDNGDVV